jgi:hypothetical protein
MDYGFDSRYRQVFSVLHSVQFGSGAHLASYPVGTNGFFSGVKRQGRGADNSPPSSAEVKIDGAIFALSHMSSWSGKQGTAVPVIGRGGP